MAVFNGSLLEKVHATEMLNYSFVRTLSASHAEVQVMLEKLERSELTRAVLMIA
jgi:hypothetical protein